MLPDFPKLKEQMRVAVTRAMQEAMDGTSPMASMAHVSLIHEGAEGELVRADGTTQDTSAQTFSTTATLDYNEFGQITLKEVIAANLDAARRLAFQREGYFMDQITAITEESGNTIDAQGEKVSPELILLALSKVAISFDGEGKPILPTFFVGSKLFDAITSLDDWINREPYETEFRELITRKKREWDARENSRKLVG